MKAASESQLVRQCLQWLNLQPGILAWRNNTGSVARRYKGKQRYVSFGAKGSPDIVGSLFGKFLGIEVKMPGGKLSAEQAVFLDAIRTTGGIAMVIRSLDELMEAVEQEMKN